MTCSGGRTIEQGEIWISWTLATHVWGTFDILVLKLIRCTYLKIRLWLGKDRSATGSKIEVCGHYYNIEPTSLYWLISFSGHSVHLPQTWDTCLIYSMVISNCYRHSEHQGRWTLVCDCSSSEKHVTHSLTGIFTFSSSKLLRTVFLLLNCM